MKNGGVTVEQVTDRNRPALPDEEFNQLYERYVQKVYQKCLTMTGNTEEARDHTHDIFLKVLNKFGDFQQRSKPSTWLYSITHNYCIDAIKQRKRHRTEPLQENLYEKAAPCLSPSDDDYAYQLKLVNQLPREELLLLKLKYEQGLSIKELSQQFGIKECALKMRLKRSRDRLKTVYERTQ